MKDQRALSYVNLFSVLGALCDMLRLDGEARALLKNGKPVRLGITVKNGPAATLVFENESCRIVEGADDCDIRLPFSTPEKFNGMVDGTVKPFPSKGFTRIGFLLKTFTRLTDRMAGYLKATPEKLENEKFFAISTEMMLYVIAGAVAQLGNQDPIGRFSASNIVDGDIELSIADGPCATIRAKDHVLTMIKGHSENPRAVMEFKDMRLARRLFDGEVNAVASIGAGDIRMRGMISMLDNLNRLLDRVSLYLS